jgi:hypothetical protein
MKIVILASMLFPCFLAMAAKDERQLLKCLGQEEKEFHLKKQTGPLYDLNQKMISEMLQIPTADIAAEDFKAICENPRMSPSWKLLELSMIKGKKLFVIPENVTGMQRQMAVGMLDDYLEATKEILLGFISQIQSHAPTPQCLKEEIPQLDEVLTEIKYLQEDVDIKKIFAGRDVKIFERLKDYPAAFEKCRQRLMRKNPKSESTEEAKNS